MRNMHAQRKKKGALLVEVMVTVVMVAMVGMGIIGAVSYGTRAQQNLIEDNSATRIAAETIETLKRIPMYQIEPIANQDIVVNEEIAGTMSLDLYRISWLNGNMVKTLVTNNNLIQPSERILVLAEVTVNWNPAGQSGNAETIVVETMLAP